MATGGNTSQTIPPAEEAEEMDECLRLSAKGYSQGQIAKQLGVSQPTVSRRIAAACKKIVAPAVAEYRLLENVKLDEQEAIAASIARDEKADPELRLKALDRLGRVSARRAALMGLDSPVKVDVTTTEISETERELQGILDQAKRDNKVQEAALRGQRAVR